MIRSAPFSAIMTAAAADAYLLACLDGDSGITRQEVVDLVTELFDSVAARIALSPTH